MNSQAQSPYRYPHAHGFRPQLNRFKDQYPDNLQRDDASGTATTVMVAHSVPLISAGMAFLLKRQSWLDVRVWDEAQGPWAGLGTDPVDFVFADSECLRRSRWSSGAVAQDHQAVPRVIWVTADSDENAPSRPDPQGISAQISVACGEKALLDALKNLTNGQGNACTPCPRAKPTGGLAPGALRRVKEHIEQHLSEHIELFDLARLAGLSECHFSRAFKQSVGVPPHRFLMSRRIAAAADLVSETDRALSEIALDVGFCDQSHFTRLFSSMLGETPSAFRRRHR